MRPIMRDSSSEGAGSWVPPSRSMPTSTARSVLSSSHSIRSSALDRRLAVGRGLPVRRRDGLLELEATARDRPAEERPRSGERPANGG
jgi:hypothetical protein